MKLMARFSSIPLHVALGLPLLLIIYLLAQGLRVRGDDPSVLLARLRAAEPKQPAIPDGGGQAPTLQDLIPGPREVDGLSAREDARSFGKENLNDLIDGAAEVFTRMGCRAAAAASLTFATSVAVSVELFDMTEVGNARKIWEQERGPDMEAVSIGDGGSADAFSLRFCKGSIYVRLTSVPSTDRTRATLEACGLAIARRIP